MAVDELIDAHVSLKQCEKAVKALHEHATKFAKSKEEKELLPGKEENVWLVLSVKKTTPEKKLKPFKIPLAHPIVDPRTTPVCLITKDPQREYKDLLASNNVKFINRVVGIEKLKGKFKPFEARRMLLRENGLFLADERVVPLLPKLLGKVFFDAKKQPLPVKLTRNVKAELEKAVSSTYMHQNQGTCTSIKIGTISQSPAHVVDNLKTALPAIVKRIDGGWENIQSFNIKTNSSASLPIWSCALGEGDEARWAAATAATEEDTVEGWSGFREEADSNASDEEVSTNAEVKKGKKRVADEEVETPIKKAKKVDGPALSDAKKLGESVKLKKLKSKSTESPSVSPKSKAAPSTKAGEPAKSKKGKAPLSPPSDDAANDDEDVTPPQKGVKFDTSAKLAPPEKKSKLSAEELKNKRAASSVEKKKKKVTKGRSGGSIKENIVGKRAKSRI